MLSSDRWEQDVFFDSKDCLSSEESDVAEDEVRCRELACGIWENGRVSVRERRESFLDQMGLGELDCGVERIVQCSGAQSSSLGSSDGEEEEEGNLVCCGREMDCGANSMVDELDNKPSIAIHGEDPEFPLSTPDCEKSKAEIKLEERDVLSVSNKQAKSWWKRLSFRSRGRGSESMKLNFEKSKFRRVEVKQNSKRRKELTALYIGQEIQAHKGLIWTMKFSPDGQYLASGGEDGVVRIWRVVSADASRRDFSAEGSFGVKVELSKLDSGRNNSSNSSVVIPDKIFWFEEAPLQELHGHTSDVLDLAWSSSNSLLSSSKDHTVRLWQVGCDECLNVFRHKNYVTCIQFDPVDENFFISGSIDGIVRIWGIPEKRVVDWTDARYVITAICYQPDGKGFVVGCIDGMCRFYDALGPHIQLDTQVTIPGRKKTSGRITSIQFSRDDSRRLMITSEDLKIRIYEKTDLVYKYKGRAKSGSQVSATFTPSGKHIISVGEDSRVSVWNYDGSTISSSKHKKSVQSCEHFLSQGASIAIPWTGNNGMGLRSSSNGNLREATSWIRDSERFSLGNWFSIDGPCRGSATWPEEELPFWDDDLEAEHHLSYRDLPRYTALPETWGLVIVTAGWDGKIRTFHNYGLPVRL